MAYIAAKQADLLAFLHGRFTQVNSKALTE